jgi:hypothetical protein
MLRFPTFLFTLSLAVLTGGCTPDETNTGVPVMMDDGHDHDHEHGHHDHPETLDDALHELTKLHTTVRDAFAKDDSDAAHDSLHDVGHILEEVTELADESKLPDDAKATIRKNVEALLDAYGAVDEKLHSDDGSEGSDYKDVAEKIDAALKIITTAAAPVLDGDHDQDHKEHDDAHKHDHDDHKDEKHDETKAEPKADAASAAEKK